MALIKVSSKSSPVKVAGALAAIFRKGDHAEVQAIGAGALNQAVKAIAICRGYVAPNGIDLVCVPTFVDVDIEGNKRTAIKLVVRAEKLGEQI
ncbi:MAG TPA: stage V sporulation protein S [Candidatus Omnitrophica bacterium]|nr:stage V sporulation protein S [Candidatus Omnitrophota bacterium]